MDNSCVEVGFDDPQMFVSLSENANHEVVPWHMNSDLGVAQIHSWDHELTLEASATRGPRDVQKVNTRCWLRLVARLST